MKEAEYIEKLKSSYPDEGEDTSYETLCFADGAVHAFPQSAKLWCIRGDLIQLGAGDAGHELSDALASYQQAIKIDPKFIEAYEEIGHFYDLVMDDEKRAKPYFRQAELLKVEIGV